MKVLHLLLIIILLPTFAQAAELSIFAASSLTEALQEVAQSYQLQHPEDKVVLHFAGSQALATQIEQGAPADLFIAANTAAMERLIKNGFTQKSRPLLQNRLVLAVQPELGEQISSIKDLARHDLLLVIGNQQVPIGKYTRQLFDSLAADPEYGAELIRKIEQQIVSEENMVKAIVAKLLLNEVDAGIVYQTDLTAKNAKNLVSVPLPEKHAPRVTYPVAQTTDRQADPANFLNFLFSNEAQQLFAKYGFLTGVDP